MRQTAAYLRSLVLAIWLGSIVFFSFAVAPAAFATLGDPDLAGNLVRHTLTSLHYGGLAAAAIFLLASLPHWRRWSNAAVTAMAALTAIAQFAVIPAMDPLRASSLPAAQAQFNHLHQLSVGLEATILLLAFIALGYTRVESR